MARQARSPQRMARRRGEILESARRLFAEEGIGPVTTGRIAEAAGISPGNLYYWFPNKAEIVRALFEEWSAASAVPVSRADEPSRILSFLWGREAAQQRISQGYAFFARELLPLLHADPVLAERYRAAYQARVDEFGGLAERVIAAGLLRAPEPPTTVRDLVALMWLVSETAAPFAEIVDSRFDSRRAVHAVLRPLLTAAGRAELEVQ